MDVCISASTLKRRRDFDEQDQIHNLEASPERKKPRPLPFRLSPTIKTTPLLFSQNHQFNAPSIVSTVTPNDSSDDEDDNYGLRQRTRQSGDDVQSTSRLNADLPSASSLSPWPPSANALVSPIPGALINQSLNLSGERTATPIYSHFTATLPRAHPPPFQGSMPVSTIKEKEEVVWWQSRRLPSPISESGDGPSYNADSTDDTMDGIQTNEHYSTEVPYQNGPALNFLISPPSPPMGQDATMTGGIDEGFHDSNRTHTTVAHGQHETTPVTTSSSRASAGSKGGKISFAMGYRADCDKCRRKVPGHYSHIIRS